MLVCVFFKAAYNLMISLFLVIYFAFGRKFLYSQLSELLTANSADFTFIVVWRNLCDYY